MFDINCYSSFLLAIVAFQLFPGAGTLAILKATSTSGIKGGMSAVLGTLVGDLIYMASAVLGLATILQKFPVALTLAQYIGVFYLCYLGLQKLFEKVDSVSNKKDGRTNTLHIFTEALTICLTNPKAIMFFMAFFPLFLSQDSKPMTLVVMMLHVSIISLIYQTILVGVGNVVSQYVSKWKYSKLVATRLAGVAFIGFGIKIAGNMK